MLFCFNDYTGLRVYYIFQAQEEKLINLIAFFPAEYENVILFFLARQDSPKFHVKVLKITQNNFLISGNAEYNKKFQCYKYVKLFKTKIFDD